MNKIKTIALVAPSGNIKNFDELNKKISILEKNFKVKKYYSENTSYLDYLSDSDEKRIEYFESAFLDKEVDLVVSIRGGYGAIRIADKINYNKIKNSNKFYLGSSDATILLIALNKKTNIKCFHGLMLTNGFIENLEKNIQIIENDIFNLNLIPINKIHTKTKPQGKLWGGNLSSLVSILSNDKLLLDEDIILFLEDLNEPLYKIDKMFYEIYRSNKLRKRIKGLIFGDFYFEENEIMPLILDCANRFSVPSYRCLDITHKPNNVTLPFGKVIELY